MERVLNKAAIEKWIADHAPRGREKLAAVSEVSMSTIVKILAEDRIPTMRTASRLATALGITLDELCQSDNAA